MKKNTKIFILGGSGFIGRHLIPVLLSKNYDVVVLLRPSTKNPFEPHHLLHIEKGDPLEPGNWLNKLSQVEVIINLVGHNVACFWTGQSKKEIFQTRIQSTHQVVSALSSSQCLINVSGIGYYGFCGDNWLTEDLPVGKSFLSQVCKQWEKEASLAKSKGARLIIARMGVVLGHGGALEQMANSFRRFIASSRLGSGKQWFSWIHIQDVLQFFLDSLQTGSVRDGVYNLSSPNPVQNEKLMEIMSRVFNTPITLPTPAFFLKAALGEVADIILKSQRVYPKKLLHEGFEFQFPHIEEALQNLLKNQLAG